MIDLDKLEALATAAAPGPYDERGAWHADREALWTKFQEECDPETVLELIAELRPARQALASVLDDHGGIHDPDGCLTCSVLHDVFGDQEQDA